ncbi:Putative DNA-binding protein in cluster with Type I restriction-modification system, partial [Bathymodiolus heckerae thiotrophic gill symbiont]|uniref:virulence protein RhuM/Fic/DOC family protein n=1 Tax=Bathymodiolus heckerae thiotrophic gill symbiont TaxID=1052212 RepID=UPI0010B35D61
MSNKLIIYQADNGAIELKGDIENETAWASQKEMAEIFGVTTQNITIHLKQIFKDNELEEKATCKESLQVQKEGNRSVKRKIKEYNLDVMIAVGYRINSAIGTKFRKWATKTLKQHIIQGFTINPSRIEQNYTNFMQAVDEVKTLTSNNTLLKTDDVLALIKSFAHTWFSLESFDEDKLPKGGLTKQDIQLESSALYEAVAQLKQGLIANNQATQLFAQEKKKDTLAGIFGNVFQSVFGEDAYPTIEEKAAHLLYFIVKNHPSNDGNKRTGAFAFIWFLQKAQLDFRAKITPEALTAITLLIAQSDPADKDKVIGLVVVLLTGNHQ